MKLTKILFTVLVVNLAIISAKAQMQEEITALENIASSFNEGKSSPGGVITVAKNSTVLFNKAFGSADLEQGIENTVNTIFEAGSVSKQFTATAALLLIRDKKLTLEDDVRKYIPELPDYGRTMKIKHLLTHTSGLKDWGSIFAITGWPRGTKAYTQNDAKDLICNQKTLNFLPGEEYSYSNANFTLLAVIVERISKISFAEFCNKNIFEPVGMKNTQWRNNFRKIINNRAVGYAKKGTEFFQDMPFEDTHGHGGLLTTTEDLLKWLDYWNKNKFGEELSKLRLTQGVLNNGKKIEYTYGAVFFKNINGTIEISHSGLTAGYRGWLAYYPQKGIAVACLGNGLTLPSKQLTETFAGKRKSNVNKGTGSISEEIVNKLQGLYKSTNGNETLEIIRRDKKAFMKTGAEVLKYSGDTLSTGSRYMVVNSGYNGFTSIIDTDTLYFAKVEKFVPSAQELQKYTGTFYSQECNANYNISMRSGKLMLSRKPGEELNMLPIYKDAFYVGGLLILFTFDSGVSISASVDRAKNISFVKKQ